MTLRSLHPKADHHGVRQGFSSILLPVNTAQPELPWDMLDLAAYFSSQRGLAVKH